MYRKLFIGLFVVLILGACALFYVSQSFTIDNVNPDIEKYELLIPPGSSFDSIKGVLERDNVLKDFKSFELTANVMKYDKDLLPSGRYVIKQGMSNREMIAKLRSGDQDPVKVIFNNVRDIDQLAGQIASSLLLDSISIRDQILSAEVLERDSINRNNVLSLFIPNTYEFYWDDSAQKVISRLISEREKFWNSENRISKLNNLKLSKEEVYTLASIVEKESNLQSERPIIASVYLNRIRQGIPLQADPTVVFATGMFDLRRVLKKHLEIDSPYNTYKNLGIPPGPIYMPSINSIDAVLQNEKTDYIFFCAKPGYNSGHLFAKTNAQHEANARIYHNWLSKEKIK